MIIYRDSCEGLRNNTCDPNSIIGFSWCVCSFINILNLRLNICVCYLYRYSRVEIGFLSSFYWMQIDFLYIYIYNYIACEISFIDIYIYMRLVQNSLYTWDIIYVNFLTISFRRHGLSLAVSVFPMFIPVRTWYIFNFVRGVYVIWFYLIICNN